MTMLIAPKPYMRTARVANRIVVSFMLRLSLLEFVVNDLTAHDGHLRPSE
jgi:hypothetical protein